MVLSNTRAKVSAARTWAGKEENQQKMKWWSLVILAFIMTGVSWYVVAFISDDDNIACMKILKNPVSFFSDDSDTGGSLFYIVLFILFALLLWFLLTQFVDGQTGLGKNIIKTVFGSLAIIFIVYMCFAATCIKKTTDGEGHYPPCGKTQCDTQCKKETPEPEPQPAKVDRTCADTKATGTDPTPFDCDDHQHALADKPENIKCSEDPCKPEECCTGPMLIGRPG